MELKEINSLVELFFKKYEEKFPSISGKSHEEIFLVSLKNKDLPDTNSGPYTYSWGNIETKIKILGCVLDALNQFAAENVSRKQLATNVFVDKHQELIWKIVSRTKTAD